MLMPKTAMYKNYYLALTKDDVWLPWKISIIQRERNTELFDDLYCNAFRQGPG